jgi:hypothetical protein
MRILAIIGGTAVLAGAFFVFGFVSPAAAVSKAECNIRYNICRDACRPDNHSCKRVCKSRFQNCLWTAS